MVFVLTGLSIFLAPVLQVRWRTRPSHENSSHMLVLHFLTRNIFSHPPVFSLCQYIPMPVLYGVFLYMGVASLSGIQVDTATAAYRNTNHHFH